jgi:hypothetical protein
MKFKLGKFKPKANEWGFYSYKFGEEWYSLLSQDGKQADFSHLNSFEEIDGIVTENEKNGKIYKSILVTGVLSEKLQAKTEQKSTPQPTQNPVVESKPSEAILILERIEKRLETIIEIMQKQPTDFDYKLPFEEA